MTRHQGRILLNLSSRCAKLRFKGIPLDVRRVRLVWMYCYDIESAFPDWKELSGSTAEAEVAHNGTAEFSLLFGPPSQTEIVKRESNVCSMVLKRPDSHTDSKSTVLPTLAYALQTDGLYPLKKSGRLSLNALWGETVFAEAIDVFNQFAGSATEEFLDTRSIGKILESYWDRLFMHLRDDEHVRQRMPGPKRLECLDDDLVESRHVEIPKMSPEMIERIILVGTETDSIPPLISRRAFCGKSATEGISIWRVFQNVVELVGRSLFIRQLFCRHQLHLLGAQETVEIHTDKLAELGQPLVYFFRIPRSIVNEPALVIEMFEVRHTDTGTRLKPVRPTPYITATQLERGKGNPFIAFSKLESAHADKLGALHTRGLLQPPNIRLKQRTEDGHHANPFAIAPNINAIPGSDRRWWSAADL